MASLLVSLGASLGASVLVSLGASSAMAQEDTRPASARSLNGPDAIEAALAAHPGYRATLVEVRRARAHLRAEGARYVPTLHLEGGFQVGNTPSLTQTDVAFPYNESVNLAAEVNHTFDTGTNLAFRATGSRSFRRVVINIPGMSAVIPFGPGYGLDVTLTVTQPFLRGFGTNVGNAELRNAEAALVQAESTRSRRANELVRDTLQAYAELWYAEQAVVIDASSRDLAVRQRADAQGRIEVGVMSPADALSLATRVASLEELLAVAEADRRSRAMLLATLLGLPLGTELHATDDPPLLGFSVPDDRAVALAVADSPALEELRAQVEAAQIAARLAGEPLRPRLDAQGQVGIHGMGYDDVPEAFGQVGRLAAVTATVNLIYETPLEDTRLHAEEERAQLGVDAAQQRLEEVRATIEQQVMGYLEQRRAARRRIELAQQTVELARQSVEAERGRIETGTHIATMLLAQEEELRSAELRLRRARVDLYNTETLLLSFVGRLLDEVDLPE
jgi:outer membrane protein TolC